MGLGPWYGLWPMNIGGKARTRGTARHDSLATGEAKPRRTSGGAASKGLLRQGRDTSVNVWAEFEILNGVGDADERRECDARQRNDVEGP